MESYSEVEWHRRKGVGGGGGRGERREFVWENREENVYIRKERVEKWV